MEAPRNASAAKGGEPSLYLEVRKRLERGALAPPSKLVRIGKATNVQTCIVCKRAIRPGQLQNEFRTDEGAKESVHTLCLRVWVIAFAVGLYCPHQGGCGPGWGQAKPA